MSINPDSLKWLKDHFPTQKAIDDYIAEVQAAYNAMAKPSERTNAYTLFIGRRR